MSLAAPWALVGLLGLPLLWWLHRRLAWPRRIDLPSLLFFVEEPGPLLAAARRRRDWQLVLALLVAALLTAAAAGPQVPIGSSGRRVRVVVAGGAACAQERYGARVEGALGALRAALGPGDRLEVAAWPGDGPTPSAAGPRPSASALAGAARAGDPGLAVVISDVLPDDPPPDVRWIAVGDPTLRNAGIVAADLEPGPQGWLALVTVLNHARVPASLAVSIEGDGGAARLPLDLGPDEARAVVRPVGSTATTLRIALIADDPAADALRGDDRVVIRRDPPRWTVDPDLPAAHREAAQAALGAVQAGPAAGAVPVEGQPRVRRSVGPPLPVPRPGPRPELADLATLYLTVLPEGAVGVHAPPGEDQARASVLTQDLSLVGLDLVYPSAESTDVAGAAGDRGETTSSVETLLWRDASGRRWPVLVRRDRELWLLPDVTRGSPPPTSTPFWPLLVENLLSAVAGTSGVAGARREGILDPATTRLGRVARPFDPEWLLAVPADRGQRPIALRPWLAASALAALAALWLLGAPRGASAGGPRPAAERRAPAATL